MTWNCLQTLVRGKTPLTDLALQGKSLGQIKKESIENNKDSSVKTLIEKGPDTKDNYLGHAGRAVLFFPHCERNKQKSPLP